MLCCASPCAIATLHGMPASPVEAGAFQGLTTTSKNFSTQRW